MTTWDQLPKYSMKFEGTPVVTIQLAPSKYKAGYYFPGGRVISMDWNDSRIFGEVQADHKLVMPIFWLTDNGNFCFLPSYAANAVAIDLGFSKADDLQGQDPKELLDLCRSQVQKALSSRAKA